MSAHEYSGSLTHRLSDGEDQKALEDFVLNAPAQISEGKVALLGHTSAGGEDVEGSDLALKEALTQIAAGKRKRYVVKLDTAAGPRVVKIVEAIDFPHKLAGLFPASPARAEDKAQRRGEELGVAATLSKGFIEVRRGGLLVRSAQIQTLLSSEFISLDQIMAEDYAKFGAQGAAPLARALARVQSLPFFHADFKGFHTFVSLPADSGAESDIYTREYDLTFLDFGRVSFWMSPRKRVINLYQLFRYLLPDDLAYRQTFVRIYCETSGWHKDNPQKAQDLTEKFLKRKLKTLPNPY
ncbi:hypothetical protein KAI87_00645 [Myxococcota bacterium]|nr:hypothetical protein [Myxococcota bacterium]